MRARYHGEAEGRTGTLNKGTETLNESSQAGFRRMFENLSDNEKLPSGASTVEALRKLGEAMASAQGEDSTDIRAIHTYFGQFIDHDITKLKLTQAQEASIMDADVKLFSEAELLSIPNARTPALDLDSVYASPAPRQQLPNGSLGALMELDTVSKADFGTIPTSDRNHDLKRMPKPAQPPTTDLENELDRAALIGDPRNDENLLVSQLHVAFIRAHNALARRSEAIDEEAKFEDARRQLIRRYQAAVLNDFLPAIGSADVVSRVLAAAKTRTEDLGKTTQIPIEFSAAAYRFGHSMVRDTYNFNSTFNDNARIKATLDLMFTFTALSGQLDPGGTDFEQQPSTLPDNWIIDWRKFFDSDNKQNPARQIDTRLALGLSRLRNVEGKVHPNLMAMLATRNLLRGYQFGLPSGQAVAKRLEIQPIDAADIGKILTALNVDQDVIDAKFDTCTPLWFYILAEAQMNDGRLGELGTTIVSETLIRLISRSPVNILNDNDKIQPGESADEFTLAGIVRLGVDPQLQF